MHVEWFSKYDIDKCCEKFLVQRDIVSKNDLMNACGQFRGDGRTVRTLVVGVYKIYCITGSYLWVIQKDITL